MEGVRHFQLLSSRTKRKPRDLFNRRSVARHDHAAGSVDCSDRDLGFLPSKPFLHLLGSGIERQHFTARRQLPHQSPARHHEPGGAFKINKVGDAGGDDLANAVADYKIGCDTPAPEQIRKRIFDRERGRLHVTRILQMLAGFGSEQRVAQRNAKLGIHHRGASVYGSLEARLQVIELLAHPSVLGALSGKYERGLDLASNRALASGEAFRDAAFAPGLQLLGDFFPGRRNHRQPMPEVGAADCRREDDVAQRHRRILIEKFNPSVGDFLQIGSRLG